MIEEILSEDGEIWVSDNWRSVLVSILNLLLFGLTTLGLYLIRYMFVVVFIVSYMMVLVACRDVAGEVVVAVVNGVVTIFCSCIY